MLSKLYIVYLGALAFAPTLALAKAKPPKQHVHDHGHAKLSLATDNDMMAIDLEIPAADVFGFEHAPSNAAEQQVIDAALADLNGKALELFILPPDLGCTVQQAKAVKHQDGDHGDVDATYKLKCAKALAGATLKIGLFKRFTRLKQVRVQVNASGKQAGQTVSSSAEAINL